jgi:hypothetical protein
MARAPKYRREQALDAGDPRLRLPFIAREQAPTFRATNRLAVWRLVLPILVVLLATAHADAFELFLGLLGRQLLQRGEALR